MQLIHLETRIAAPPDRCFLLSLSIDLHKESTAQTQERAIAGVTHGLIGPGQTVTWQGRHFGVVLQHQTLKARKPWRMTLARGEQHGRDGAGDHQDVFAECDK